MPKDVENPMNSNRRQSVTLKEHEMSSGDEVMNFEKAMHFRKSVLPQRLYDTTSKKWRQAGLGETHALDQDGKQGAPVENYNFWKDGNEQFDEFGIGISMYMDTVMAFGFLFLLLALINLGAVGANDYDDQPAMLKGSAFGAVLDDLTGSQTSAAIFTTFILAEFAIIWFLFEENAISKIDDAAETTEDYSVVLHNPPPEITDPEVYRNFFEDRWGDVLAVTVARINGTLINKLAELRALKYQLSIDQKIAGGKLGYKEADWACIRPYLVTASHETNLEREATLEGEIKTLKSEFPNPDAWKVYVTFNSQATREKCIDTLKLVYSKQSVELKMESDDKTHNKQYKGYRINDTLLHVTPAPEPSTVLYRNCDQTFNGLLIGLGVSYGATLLMVVISFFIIQALAEKSPAGLGIVVPLINTILPQTIFYLTQNWERHASLDTEEASLLFKILFFRIMSTTALIYIATKWEDRFSEDALLSAQNVLIVDCFLGPFYRVLDPIGLFYRHILAPKVCSTQIEYNTFFLPNSFSLAERYTDIIKTASVGLFFSIALPSGLFITSFAMFTTYFSDKWALFNYWETPPKFNQKIPQLSKLFFVFLIFMQSIAGLYYFSNWPFNATSKEADCAFIWCTLKGPKNVDKESASNFYQILLTYGFVCFICTFIVYGILAFYLASFGPALTGRTTMELFNGPPHDAIRKLAGYIGLLPAQSIAIPAYLINKQLVGQTLARCFPTHFAPTSQKQNVVSNAQLVFIEGEPFYIPRVRKFNRLHPCVCVDTAGVSSTRYPTSAHNLDLIMDKKEQEQYLSKVYDNTKKVVKASKSGTTVLATQTKDRAEGGIFKNLFGKINEIKAGLK